MAAESLPPYTPDELQYERLRYSPDDFNPDMPISREAFTQYFALEAATLIRDYKSKKIKVDRSLHAETRRSELQVRGFIHAIGKQVVTWGDCRDTVNSWTEDWDERHGYTRPTTSDSPTPSEPIE